MNRRALSFWRRAIQAPLFSPAGMFRALVLWPLAWLYRFGAIIDGALSNKRHFRGCAVISIGNITVGGSGKTPLVGWLANRLIERTYKVGIVCSGYGRTTTSFIAESGAKMLTRSAAEVGDEALMLAERLPDCRFAIHSDKSRSVGELQQRDDLDVILVDDGFQTRSLKCDFDIVAINSQANAQELRPFPAGLLRESLGSLKRADMVVFTNLTADTNQLPPALELLKARAPLPKAQHFSSMEFSLEAVTGEPGPQASEPTLLISGLADPGPFRRAASDLGVNVVATIEFPDHFPYDITTVEEIRRKAESSRALWLVTTEKDWVKLRVYRWPFPVSLIKQTVRLAGSNQALELLEQVITARKSGS